MARKEKRHNICQSCFKPYYRRNLTEMWLTRNPGHRAGWHKQIAKICNACLTIEQSKRMLTYVDASFAKPTITRPRKSVLV